jgi:hypothetical protein
MKKKIFFLGMTVLILSLGLVFVGCGDDDDDGSNKDVKLPAEYLGTWKEATPVSDSLVVIEGGVTLEITQSTIKGKDSTYKFSDISKPLQGGYRITINSYNLFLEITNQYGADALKIGGSQPNSPFPDIRQSLYIK